MATMMKRGGANGAVHDIPVSPKEHFVPVSKIPEPTKVVWHVDPAALVGPREEEARRKAPEGKYLYAISACLTLMVLWGVFRHMHLLVPHMFSYSSAASQEESLISLDQVKSDVTAFHGVGSDFDSSLGGRKAAKHLLGVDPDHFLAEERKPWRRVFRPHKGWDQHQHPEQTYHTGPGESFGRRRQGST